MVRLAGRHAGDCRIGAPTRACSGDGASSCEHIGRVACPSRAMEHRKRSFASLFCRSRIRSGAVVAQGQSTSLVRTGSVVRIPLHGTSFFNDLAPFGGHADRHGKAEQSTKMHDHACRIRAGCSAYVLTRRAAVNPRSHHAGFGFRTVRPLCPQSTPKRMSRTVSSGRRSDRFTRPRCRSGHARHPDQQAQAAVRGVPRGAGRRPWDDHPGPSRAPAQRG